MGLELGALSEAAAFFATVPEDEVVADPLLDEVSETLQNLTSGPIAFNIPLRGIFLAGYKTKSTLLLW